MNPLKEGNVSHIMMLPTIEKMSLPRCMRINGGKNKQNMRNEPVVARFVVRIVVGVLVVPKLANEKAEERSENVNGAATAIIVEGTYQVAQAQPTVDHIRKNLRKTWAQAQTFNRSSIPE
jgi:hypothetical protein